MSTVKKILRMAGIIGIGAVTGAIACTVIGFFELRASGGFGGGVHPDLFFLILGLYFASYILFGLVSGTFGAAVAVWIASGLGASTTFWKISVSMVGGALGGIIGYFLATGILDILDI